jgi:hypothetical protein
VALKLVPTGNDREAREILEAERWGAKLQEQFCRTSGHVPAVYDHGTEWGYFTSQWNTSKGGTCQRSSRAP